MAAGGGQHYSPPRAGLRDRVGQALRGAASSAARRLVKFAWTAPAVKGIGNLPTWFNLPRDQAAEQRLQSRDALYGRATYTLGPVNNFISTYPGSGLTPERIAAIHNEVLVAGWMLNKACLDEQILLRDAHMEAVDRGRRVAVTGRDFSLEPFGDTKLAQQVADYTDTWVHEIDRFAPAMYELLFANAAGYALQEAIYEDRTVKFLTEVDGKLQHLSVQGPHPRQLDWVSNKHTRFEVGTDTLVFDLGNGRTAGLPEHKFIVHVVPGDFQKRRRGYMYQAVWWHLLKHAAMARWGVVLDIWGIPVPLGKAQMELWQDEKRKAEMQQALINYGLGHPALFTDDFELVPGPQVSAGDARGMHAALIGAANQEISKLVQGETLTTELGGVGGYNTSETHADVKESIVRMDERALSDSLRSFIREVIKLNLRALASALRADPADILRVIPVPYWRIERAVTPQIGLQMIDMAVNKLRLPVAEGAVMRQYGLPRARTLKDRIRGQTEIIPEGGTAVPTTEAGNSSEQPQSPQTGGGKTGSLESLELTPSAQSAIINVNEAREYYGLPPKDGGDVPIIEVLQQNPQQPMNPPAQEKQNGDGT